jgi:hypothetical protein
MHWYPLDKTIPPNYPKPPRAVFIKAEPLAG